MAETKTMRSWFMAALFSIALMLAMSLGASPAYADLQAGSAGSGKASSNDLVNGHVYILYTSLNSNMALDISGASTANGANAQIYSNNRTAAQQWRYTVDSNGYGTFTCVSSGKVLDIRGAGKKSGTNVWQYASNGTKAQKWSVSKNSDGTYTLTSALSNSLVLDVSGARTSNGTNVQVWTSNGTKAQKWKLFDVTAMPASLDKAAKSSKTLPAGTYYIRSSIDNNMVLDVSGGSKANSANVQLYELNLTAAQKWTISYDSNGYATIKNGSSKVLDVRGAGVKNGTNVQQYQSNSTRAQKWIISKNSDGTYTIKSALWTNVVLDVSAGKAFNGSNVQIDSSNSTKAQKWQIVPVSSVKNKPMSLSPIVKNSFNGISLSGAKAVGIDVAHWQGYIDWNKVAASGIDFAIIQCGYGDDLSSQDDPWFLYNVKQARNAGVDIGVYLYSYAIRTTGEESATSEAEHTLRLLKTAGLSPSDLKYGVYYDLEDKYQENAPLTSIATTYCTKIRNAGYTVGVYSSLDWFNGRLSSSTFNNWNRWVAQWPYKTGGQRCSYGGKYVLWQCMSDGSVPGISGRVDMNLAY